MGRPRMWMLLGVVLALGLLAVACGESAEPRIRNARLEVGDKAPDFRLPDHSGGYIAEKARVAHPVAPGHVDDGADPDLHVLFVRG